MVHPDAGKRLAATLLANQPPPPSAVIGGFWPIDNEIDVRVLLETLHVRGHPLALPETLSPGEALIFRAWQPGDELVAGRFGTWHPTGPILQPDFILVPLLAFDRAGNRLGYGAGYYDRTLSELAGAYHLGCGYAAQEVPRVPTGPHDQKLHAVATEAGVVNIGKQDDL
jgi:5-formyltetrahydrofolate cyclo-ligase